jgi:hypothetical protein
MFRPTRRGVLGSPERGASGVEQKARLPGAMLLHESEGRRERESGPRTGEILVRRGSEAVKSTSTRRKSSPFAGRRRKRVSAEPCPMVGVSNPATAPTRRPGCSGATTRRGAHLRVSPSLACSRPAPPRLRSRRRGSSRCSSTRTRAATGVGPRSPSRTMIERSPSVLARRKRCRSRQAASGPEKRESIPS